MPAIPPHNTAVVDAPWDGPAVVAKAPNDATVLRYMHAWRDPSMDPNLKGAYSFPHHDGAAAPANLNGVRNALARLPGSNVPQADRGGVQAHLQAHLDAQK
jgi:hypothetical protein